MHWIYLIHEFHNLSWITEINELFHHILIYWDAPIYIYQNTYKRTSWYSWNLSSMWCKNRGTNISRVLEVSNKIVIFPSIQSVNLHTLTRPWTSEERKKNRVCYKREVEHGHEWWPLKSEVSLKACTPLDLFQKWGWARTSSRGLLPAHLVHHLCVAMQSTAVWHLI